LRSSQEVEVAAVGEAVAAASVAEESVVAGAYFYRPELDVLRFCAAFGVFVFHSFPKNAGFWTAHGIPALIAVPMVSLIGSGSFGVDLFFALSSFLITELLLREREKMGFLDVKAFYVRRILRIWPLYFFFVGLSYAATFLDASQHFDGKDIAGFLLLSGNWIVVLRGMPQSIASPLWSVSVEEQFYLSWPQVVRNASEQTIKKIAWGLIAVSVFVRAMLALRGVGESAVWCNTFTRLDPIAMGILFAVYIRNRPPLNLNKLERQGLALGGVICWVLITRYSGLHDLPPRFWGTILGYPIASIGSMALLIAVYDAPRAGFHVLENKILIYLGKISYGIYVYHLLGLLISHHLFGAYTQGAAGYLVYWFTALGLTILFAVLSYWILETPFLHLKNRFTYVSSRPA
jgi:peptidoglycan/LPS O-acetylase OafA/YrhL